MPTHLFKKRLVGVILATALVQACASKTETSNASDTAKSYYVSSAQDYLKSSQNNCVRTINWTSNGNVVECNAVAPAPKQAEVGSALVSYSARALFEFDSSELTGEGQQQLNQLTNKLNSQDKITSIDIVGHADSIGTDSYNLALSERRAEAVKGYLEQSLQSVSVTASGLGESAPIGDNELEEGRKLNRRVDVRIAATQER